MGFFDKIFGKNKPSNENYNQGFFDLEKSAEMLDEDYYWKIIHSALQFKNNQEKQSAFLEDYIETLSPKEIIGFKLRTDKLLKLTYSSKMWCAAYIINGGCSDDGFDYFRAWLISQGKQVFYNALDNPDSLVSVIAEDKEYEFEDFLSIANNVFENKTGKDLYDFVDNDTIFLREGNYPQIDFNWEEDNPESMKTCCPKLFGKCWN